MGYEKLFVMGHEKLFVIGNEKFLRIVRIGFNIFPGNNHKKISGPGQTPTQQNAMEGHLKFRLQTLFWTL